MISRDINLLNFPDHPHTHIQKSELVPITRVSRKLNLELIAAELGEGQFGKVYEIIDLIDKKIYAVKNFKVLK